MVIKMRILQNKVLLIRRHLSKKNEKFAWAEIKFETLINSKGKTFLIPAENDAKYFEVLEIVGVGPKKDFVDVKLYNYNFHKNLTFINHIKIKKNEKELEGILIKNEMITTKEQLETVPIPFCNFVTKKMKYGMVNCTKKTYLENLNYCLATHYKGKNNIELVAFDVSDRKNPKELFRNKEKFKKSNKNTLFNHLFAASNTKEIKKEKEN